MHCRKEHSYSNKDEKDFFKCLLQAFLLPFFSKSRSKFYPEHNNIGSNTERHLKHDGIQLCKPWQDKVIGLPITTDIKEYRHSCKGITEHACKQCGPDEGVILALVENIDKERHGISTTGKGSAYHNIVCNPYPPRIAVTHIAHRT